jgi:integrase
MSTEIRHVPSDPDGKPFHFYRERKGQLVFRAKYAEKWEAENCTRRIKKLYDEKRERFYWQGDETIKGRRYRPRGDSKEEVETILSTIRLRQRQDKYDIRRDDDPVTIEELVAERLRDFDLNNTAHRHNKTVLEMFRAHFPAAKRVDRLTDADILAYKRGVLEAFRKQHGRDMRANSITRNLEIVAAMLNHAGDYFPSLSAWKHPKMHYEKAERRERVISRSEEAKLLAALRRERQPKEVRLAHVTRGIVADLWEFAPLVGMRRSEMRRLEKGWIDFRERLIQLPRHVTKTKRAREVPLNDDALALINRRLRATPPDCKFVFANARGTNALSEHAMYRAVKKAATSAQVDYGRNIEGGFVLHDARHTAVTRMLHGGHDLATVGDVVGHSKETMTLTYAHATLQSKRRAVDSLMRKEGER